MKDKTIIYNIQIYVTLEENREFDVDVYYEDENDGVWNRDEVLSKMEFQSEREAKQYVMELKEKDGMDYNILSVMYPIKEELNRLLITRMSYDIEQY